MVQIIELLLLSQRPVSLFKHARYLSAFQRYVHRCYFLTLFKIVTFSNKRQVLLQ